VNSATPEGSSKPSDTNLLGSEKLLFILDWIPVRVTSLGYLLVGHFGKGLPVWVDTLFDNKLPTYDLLAKVARASEDTYPGGNPFLDEPLQLVKLVKRNIVFLLMLVSLATMVGVVA
jgi:AmpE protein